MGKKVTREGVIATLVSNPNVKEAAQVHGVSERTLHRWLKEPDFAVQLAETQRGVTRRVMRSIISRSEKAVGVLDEIMSNGKASPFARVQAARSVLEFTFKAAEIEDILVRLEALERNGGE